MTKDEKEDVKQAFEKFADFLKEDISAAQRQLVNNKEMWREIIRSAIYGSRGFSDVIGAHTKKVSEYSTAVHRAMKELSAMVNEARTKVLSYDEKIDNFQSVFDEVGKFSERLSRMEKTMASMEKKIDMFVKPPKVTMEMGRVEFLDLVN